MPRTPYLRISHQVTKEPKSTWAQVPTGAVKTWAGLLATVLALATCGRPGPNVPEPRQVILVSLDTLRADHVGPWRPEATSITPNLDALAARSVAFINTLSPATSTTRAHKSLFYGLYNHTHRTAMWQFPVAERVVAPVEVIRQSGLTTVAFACRGGINEKTGLFYGFEHVKMRKCRFRHQGADLMELQEQAFPWLRDHAEKEFFLFLHTYQTHLPFWPDAQALQRAGRRHGLEEGWPPLENVQRRTTKEWRELDLTADERLVLEALYEAEVEGVDAWFGELAQLLKDLGIYERAAVIVVSDHGEALGEGDHIGHGKMGDEQTFVPLIMKVPGAAPRAVSDPVSLVDVMPTILDLLELEPPFTFQGLSLRPILAGKEAVPDDRLRIVEQGMQVALYRDDWKLTFDRQRANSEHLSRWRNEADSESPKGLARNMMGRYAATVRQAQPLAEKFVLDPATAQAEFSDDTVEQLRVLGYLD